MNLYQQFQALIPKASQIIATVQLEHADGTTTCLTLDSQQIRVRGVNGRAAGAKVLIALDPALGSSIIGDAPDLPGFVVDI
jgi:hypothetical protein